jgi:putative N-acetyltransferase (TIGR04045 family)
MKPELYRVKLASEEMEFAGALQLRVQVFCMEQGIFSETDRDAIDLRATMIVATYGAEVVGTVRIHEEETGMWFGSRLAVKREHRRAGIVGPALIRMAVGTAHARGANSFFAHVQSANAAFFERMHWTSVREELLHGHPHHFMQADLAHYPPIRQEAMAA